MAPVTIQMIEVPRIKIVLSPVLGTLLVFVVVTGVLAVVERASLPVVVRVLFVVTVGSALVVDTLDSMELVVLGLREGVFSSHLA